MHPRLDDEHIIRPPPRSDLTPEGVGPSTAPTTVPTGAPSASEKPENAKKFRLASELNQTINPSTIAKKIMDTTIELPMREIFAVAPDVAGYIHEQTRKKRIPLTTPPVGTTAKPTTMEEVSDSVQVSAAMVNSTQYKSFYACPSGRAKVLIDDQIKVEALLDNGSEVIMMPRRVFERLELPIDTEIDWRINGYDTKTSAMLEEAKPLGCCHDVSIDIGGVGVKSQVFVVEYCNADLILGRPWERAVRARYINEDDGSYMVIIKSPDGRRFATFCAVKGEHHRNREFVRHAEEGCVGEDSLKL